jgi:signal transduction histidine kinase
LLEDNAEDAALVARELRRVLPTCDLRRVDTREQFVAAVSAREQDIILSDHRLADFSGMHALEIARERQPGVPFIFVTGSLDEETAVECVKAGAWDYVIKDRLVRLGPAVRAALELRRTRNALRDSQEQLLHTQRMDALGRLAGSVAHDFNNLMTAVIGYSALLAESMVDDPRRADLDEIRHAGERAVGITRQLLAFSRKQVIEFKPVHVNAQMEGLSRLIARLLGESITLDVTCAPDLPYVYSDPGQLEQVLINLAVNARDAMPDGGSLAIATSAVTIDADHQSRHQDAALGPHVRLSVVDSGTGIPDEVLARMFEPFFTTKPRGQGTGLGLATVYGIVRQSNGHIVVSTSMGRGTRFDIYLPAMAYDAAGDHPVMRRSSSVAGTEHVLVVERDPSVRGLARRILSSHGYHVWPAGTTAEAFAVAQAHERLDLAIVDDVLLPTHGDADALCASIQALHPRVRIVFTSGSIEQGAGDAHCPTPSARVVIAKPFGPEQLLERVRGVLDSPNDQ